jgi:hypothetical protein
LALLEAALWNMKMVAPKIASISEVKLSPKEIEFAEDRLRPFPKFRTNLTQTFEIFAKVHLYSLIVNQDKDFESLCKTYELRNRIMHPKRPFDLDVSDQNMDDAIRGVVWFRQTFDNLMRATDAKTQRMIARARKG